MTTGNPTQWRIDVIKVPLAAPETAAIVSQPRIFTDPATGAFNGLQNTLPGTRLHPSGTVYSPTPNTNTCHDITAYPELGLAAGACQGNGILLDISDPVNPVRLDAVSDPNFSYWHSATLNNDGTKVIFTDEWGGGTSARCRSTDRPEWGADAIFDIVDGADGVPQLLQDAGGPDDAGELRRPQLVAAAGAQPRHPRPGVVPGRSVGDRLHRLGEPGRDRLLRPWSDQHRRTRPGSTSAACGRRTGTTATSSAREIARGFDTFGFLPTDMLSQNEIDAASQIQLGEFNSQHQTMFTWEPSWSVVGANFDQAVRNGQLDDRTATSDRQPHRERHAARGRRRQPTGDPAPARTSRSAWSPTVLRTCSEPSRTSSQRLTDAPPATPVTGVQDLTPEWCTGVLDAAVTDLRVEPVGTGQVADTVRLFLDYDPPGAGPPTLIAKVPAAEEDSRTAARLTRTYEIEASFYRDLAANLPVRTPSVLPRRPRRRDRRLRRGAGGRRARRSRATRCTGSRSTRSPAPSTSWPSCTGPAGVTQTLTDARLAASLAAREPRQPRRAHHVRRGAVRRVLHGSRRAGHAGRPRTAHAAARRLPPTSAAAVDDRPR